ncbi:MAG: tetratricopeptide repeat protein [Rhodospirillales bacterium]
MLSVLLLAGSSLFAAAQAPLDQGQLDASPTLFTVMAAINAAGYDAELDSPSNSPVRQMVRQTIAANPPACLPELKTFFATHRQNDPTAELSQYISFALSVGEPPDFAFRYRLNELPPDVTALDGFQKLLVRFYKEAGIDQLWRKAMPAYEEAIARYQRPAMNAVLQVNAYVRSSTSPAMGSRFQIYIDLLGAPNQIQTRSYRNDYFIVLTASTDLHEEDIRHGYLHHTLDALAVRYAEELGKKKALLDFAQPAPLLAPYYKSDFLLLATECLIKAIESRLAPAAKRQALVDQAFKEGFILTPAFAEALPAYEKQEQALRFYFLELVNAIDLAREDKRLANVEFAASRPERTVKVVPAEQPPALTGPQKLLEDAEQLYTRRELDKAKALYQQLLKATGEKTIHARAYYGLARIAALQRDPQLAEELFQKTLDSAPDPQTAAWANVYLGRLADAAGDRELATRRYQAALSVQGGSEAAREAAQKGLGAAYGPKSQQP